MTFTEFPNVWTLTDAEKADDKDEDDSDSEDGDEGANTVVQQSQEAKSTDIPHRLVAYREFLQFLELGCSGSPSQGYPTIVIILSTIPSPVRSNAEIIDVHVLIHVVLSIDPRASRRFLHFFLGGN
jgi:E3 ubiquitin-protein ligase listerin